MLDGSRRFATKKKMLGPSYYSTDDTIAAVASATGGAYRGILRLSGPSVVSSLEPLFVSEDSRPLSDIRNPTVLAGQFRWRGDESKVPCDLYLWPDARSFTRQVLAELHTVGSPPVLSACLRTLCRASVRQAKPGEFTQRAFLAGRLDLTQAEAVLGVIDAKSQRQLDVALRQLAGGLAHPLQKLRDDLLSLLAHVEASLDFAHEDIDTINHAQLENQLVLARNQVCQVLQQMQVRDHTRRGARVVLVGAPNVGKSSLLNSLAGDQVALVSDVPGTTRDYVSRHVSVGGELCEFIDTAGLGSVGRQDPIDELAQQVSAEQHRLADLQLLCMDASTKSQEWQLAMQDCDETMSRILVVTKTDQPSSSTAPPEAIRTSALTGAGLEDLRQAIANALASQATAPDDVVMGTAARCWSSLEAASRGLERTQQVASTHQDLELVAVELRSVLDDLGEVVGAVYTDDILDKIFSQFCIGK